MALYLPWLKRDTMNTKLDFLPSKSKLIPNIIFITIPLYGKFTSFARHKFDRKISLNMKLTAMGVKNRGIGQVYTMPSMYTTGNNSVKHGVFLLQADEIS